MLGYTPRRVSRDRPTSLTRSDPTVALTRLQSGVGALTIRAVVPAAVGDLRLAVAYTLHSGESSLLSAARGLPVAPRGSRRPVVSGSWEGQETLRVDLRQVTAIDRLVVVAFSQSGAPLAWGGALVVETFGGARIDAALDHPPTAGVLVALSVSAVAGELVLRAEDELLPGGTLRDAALAYGFDRITWVDPWSPLA